MWLRLRRLLKYVFFREPNRLKGFAHRFRHGVVVLVVVTALNGACYSLGFYEKFEWADSDQLFRTSASHSQDLPGSIVLISDDDYDFLFHNTSPLAAGPLLDIVEGICRFGPRVVGIDILTGDWAGEEKKSADERVAALARGPCKVVWVREANEILEEQSQPRASSLVPYFDLGKVVGAPGPPEGICSALPLLFPDADGVVRRYSKSVMVSFRGGAPPAPYTTLVGALTSEECNFLQNPGAGEQEPKKIRFTENSAIVRLSPHQVRDVSCPQECNYFQELQRLLRGSTVILGGSYRAARDRYLTPIGPKYGAEILANAIKSVNSPIQDVKLPLIMAKELLVAVMLLALVTWMNLRLPWALIASTLFSVIAAFLISWHLFNYSGYFVGVFGALAGVVLAVMADVVWDPLREEWRVWKRNIPRK